MDTGKKLEACQKCKRKWITFFQKNFKKIMKPLNKRKIQNM